MKKPVGPTRRSLLATGVRVLAAANLTGLPKFARAASASGRSAVCLYLMGGSDGNALIAPLDAAQYSAYAGLRRGLALPAAELAPIEARVTRSRYGLHPAMAPLQELFTEGVLAVVANIGTQERVTSVDHSKGDVIPSELRYASLAFADGGYSTLNWAAERAGVSITDESAVSQLPHGMTAVALDGSPGGGLRRNNPDWTRIASSNSFRTAFPDSRLGEQLKIVASAIGAGHGAGTLFFVPVQVSGQSGALRTDSKQFGASIAAFHRAVEDLGAGQRVTLFTDSEFGRSLRPNANNAVDAGWGNHHFVLGGGVLGGEIYGTYPDMNSAPLDADGALIPTTMRDRYSATIANWLGVSYGDVARLFPSLTSSADWRMGFLG